MEILADYALVSYVSRLIHITVQSSSAQVCIGCNSCNISGGFAYVTIKHTFHFRSCQVVHDITLERTSSSPGNGPPGPGGGTLGFSIVGGCDSYYGHHPIYIKSVVPGTPAGRDGRLRFYIVNLVFYSIHFIMLRYYNNNSSLCTMNILMFLGLAIFCCL